MPVEIKAWRCEHCREYRLTKRSMEKHEVGCIANPVNRACRTCEHDSQNGLAGFACSSGVDKRGKKVIRHCNQWAEKGVEF